MLHVKCKREEMQFFNNLQTWTFWFGSFCGFPQLVLFEVCLGKVEVKLIQIGLLDGLFICGWHAKMFF